MDYQSIQERYGVEVANEMSKRGFFKGAASGNNPEAMLRRLQYEMGDVQTESISATTLGQLTRKGVQG